MKTTQIVAWIAALALISNADGDSKNSKNLFEIMSKTIADLSEKLTACHAAQEKSKFIFIS